MTRYAKDALWERPHAWIVASKEFCENKGYRPAMVFEGVEGYFTPMPDELLHLYGSRDPKVAQLCARKLNKQIGVRTDDEWRIRRSTIPGTIEWETAQEQHPLLIPLD